MSIDLWLLQSHKRDHPGQSAQRHRLRDVILKARSQAGQPVFGRAQTCERRGRDITSLGTRQLSNFSDQPIAVPVRHGNAAQESVRLFFFEAGQARYGGIDARHLRAA
jgi:hypothetical protein